MVFELGKIYEHETGIKIKIQGKMKTETYGDSLIAEDLSTGELIPVGETENHALNWHEAK